MTEPQTVDQLAASLAAMPDPTTMRSNPQIMRQRLVFTDLDTHPEWTPAAISLFSAHCGGRDHAVCGEPSRMGCHPERDDLGAALGMLVALSEGSLVGILGICSYSERQVTLWGPIVDRGRLRQSIGSALLREARKAIRDGGFDSVRALVDLRNRVARSFALANGLAPWKDNHIFERSLENDVPLRPPGVSLARLDDHADITRLLAGAFPESGYIEQPLSVREREGYRHYILQDGGHIVATAAVRVIRQRTWLNLIAVDPSERGRRLGSALLNGVLHLEAGQGTRQMGLEVLADNLPAIRLYQSCGFRRAWTATIMTGPV